MRKPTAEFREETTSFCRPGIATLCHDCDFLVKSLLCEKYYRMRLVDKHAEGLGTANSELRHCPAKGPLPPIRHPPEVRAASTTNLRLPPSAQFDPDPSTFPSNPGPASTRREPRSLNLETLSPDHGSRSVDLGAWNLALGPWSRVQARLQVRF